MMKRSVMYRPLLMLGVLVIAALACMGPAAATSAPGVDPTKVALEQVATAASVQLTQVAQQNSQPAQQQQPTEAPQVENVPPASPAAGQQYFTEEFDTDSGNWSPVIKKNTDTGDPSLAKIDITGSRLVFSLDKNLIAYMFYQPYEYTNVRIDAHVENRGTNVNDILLVCRDSSEGHYLVNVANSGLFAMYAFDAASNSYARIADGGSKKIKSGKEFNDYGLVCNDRDITLYINGAKVRQYTDNRFVFHSGKIGVGVASEDQIPVKIEFDSVKISEP